MELYTDSTVDLSSLLQEQYRHVEEYCNAQIRLYNSTVLIKAPTQTDGIKGSLSVNKNMETSRAVAELSNAVACVRQDLKGLTLIVEQQSDDSNTIHHSRMVRTSLLREHIHLSRRVIQTISHNPSWHVHGIPTTSFNMESNMVALASLKASIARLSEYVST
jgi:hypothetical protein